MLGLSRQEYPLFIAGLVQGVSLPVIEMLVAVLASAGTQVFFRSTIDPSLTLQLTVAVLLALDLSRNIVIGLSHSRFAKGNIIGNTFGLGLFYATIHAITPAAAAMSLLFTGVLAISFAIGLVMYTRAK